MFLSKYVYFFMQMSGSYDKMLLLRSTMIILSDNPYTWHVQVYTNSPSTVQVILSHLLIPLYDGVDLICKIH